MDRTELQIMFAADTVPKPDQMLKVQRLYNTLEYRETGNVISKEELESLQRAIDDAGGCYKFSKDHPQFNMRQVYDVYNGNRVRKSKLVQQLFAHFKIETDDESVPE